MDIRLQVASHYGNDDIYGRIVNALAEAGIAPGRLTVEDLAPVDQFHTGGLPATQSLAEKATIGPATRVLDAGCGIGGPARYLAKTYGCEVTAVDLVERYVETARLLNDLLGLSHKVICQTADITNTGFPDASFDVVWSQNVLMNVPDKAAVFREAHRLLRPGGTFLVQTLMRGDGQAKYPLMWASGPEMDCRCTSEEFLAMAKAAGFQVTSWQEAEQPASPSAARPAASLNYGVIMNFADFADAMANTRALTATGGAPRGLGALTK